jgi:phage-related protein
VTVAGPGGKEVGRVSVRVTPNTSEFPEDLRKELKNLEKSLKLQIPVELVTEQVKEELKKVKDSTKREKIQLEAELDGDGLVRETRRIKNLAQKAATAIKLTASIDYKTTIARIRADMAIINKIVSAYKIKIPIDLVSWGRMLAYATAIAATLLTIPHILGAIGGAISVVGGLLATLPAIAAGFGLAIGAIAVGTKGFFAALGASGDPAAFEEALKKLTPSAQSAARALAEFKEPLAEIRKVVQERLFEGMDETFRSLKELLPGVKSGLAGAANGVRGMVQEWAKMATTQESQDDLTRIGVHVASGLREMKPVLADIGSVLKDFAVVGSSLFTEWGSEIAGVTGRFREWASEARKTGEMREWIENALEKIKQLGRVIADVWAGFSNISEAMRGGKEFLDIIEGMTQSFREFTEEVAVQDAFKNIGKVLGQIVDVGTDVFGELFRTIGRVLKDAMPFIQQFVHVLGVVLMAIIRTVGPMLQGLARFFSENKEIIAPLVIALIGLVTAFKLAATAAQGIIAIRDSYVAMKAAAKILGNASKAFGAFVIDVLKGTVKVVAYLATQIAAFVRWSATVIAQAAKASAAWIASAFKSMMFTARYYTIMAAQAIAAFVRMTVAAVANAAKTAAAWVAGWVAMAAAATLNAIRMAAAWVIAMGPIGWIIAAIIALVALIILNWDEIVAATRAAWDWVWKLVSDVITAVVNWVKERISDLVDIFWNVVGWIGDALSGVWDAITYPFEKAFGYVKGLISDVMDAFSNMLGTVNGSFKGGSLTREEGGPVIGGNTYLANESGPELYTKSSGETFLMAGPIGEFTPPAAGYVTSNRDLASSLLRIGSGDSDSSNVDFEDFMERLLSAMGGWSVSLDPSGMAKMVRKENIKNKRRN